MKNKMIFASLVITSIFVAFGAIGITNLGIANYNFIHSTYFEWQEIQASVVDNSVNVPRKRPAPVKKTEAPMSGTIREITAYNAGDPAQTDASPCDGAGGNICEALDRGEKVCAANFVKLGTKLNIQGYGVCTVLDRMNKRFSNRVDIAMKLDEKHRAIAFGRQNLLVQIVKK